MRNENENRNYSFLLFIIRIRLHDRGSRVKFQFNYQLVNFVSLSVRNQTTYDIYTQSEKNEWMD